MSSLWLLTTPKLGDTLTLYLVALESVVNPTLIRGQELETNNK